MAALTEWLVTSGCKYGGKIEEKNVVIPEITLPFCHAGGNRAFLQHWPLFYASHSLRVSLSRGLGASFGLSFLFRRTLDWFACTSVSFKLSL